MPHASDGNALGDTKFASAVASYNALLAGLITHSTRPEFICQHKWKAGDFLLWDNCSVQHQAVSDYQLPLRRHMERTTLVGTAPY